MTCAGAQELITAGIAEQLAALEHRVAAANAPGSLDGLFARHVLGGTVMSSFAWQVSPFSGSRPGRNSSQLTTGPQLAVLGYSLTHPGHEAAGDAAAGLSNGLRELMRRDPDPPDGVTFLHDTRQLTGIALAAILSAGELPEFGRWLRHVLDSARPGDGTRHDLFRQHARGMLTGEAAVITTMPASRDVAGLALAHWMAAAGTALLPNPGTSLKALQAQIISGLMRTRATDMSVPDAALLRRAAGDIIDATIDSAILSRSHVAVVLRRFTPAMRRWRWDDPAAVKDPVQWPVNSEREVQDILWALLRAVFDDLVDEEPLRKAGHSSYRPDFGLPRLGVLVEVKYVRTAAEFRKIEKEIYEDTVAYFRDHGTYKKLVVFIYDASASVQEHATTQAALLELEDIIDVVIVSRPSQLPPPGRPGGTAGRTARQPRAPAWAGDSASS